MESRGMTEDGRRGGRRRGDGEVGDVSRTQKPSSFGTNVRQTKRSRDSKEERSSPAPGRGGGEPTGEGEG